MSKRAAAQLPVVPLTLLLLAVSLFAAFGLLGVVAASGRRASSDSVVAERFRPILFISNVGQPCASGLRQQLDPYDPVPVEIFLRGAAMGDSTQLRQDRRSALLLGGRTPTADDLASHPSKGNYIDIPKLSPAKDPISPARTYARACAAYAARYEKLKSGFSPTIYTKISEASGGKLIASKCGRRAYPLRVAYWFFYYFDNWIGNRVPRGNQHEGDWEHIDVFFAAPSSDEVLKQNADPVEVRYAEHRSGTCHAWADQRVAREGDHPVVYVARGSHASYFQPQAYRVSGTLHDYGPSQSESRRVDPAVVLLPRCSDAAARSGPFAWMSFQGHWGQETDRDDKALNFFSGPMFGGRCG